MTKEEALKQALEALENAIKRIVAYDRINFDECKSAITAINEALAAPEQEPANIELHPGTNKVARYKNAVQPDPSKAPSITSTDYDIGAFPLRLQPEPAQEPVAWCTKSDLENMAKGFSQDVPARSMRVPQLYPKEGTVLLYTTPPTAQQCKWPSCQTEEYQQALAEQIKQELFTGTAPPQFPTALRKMWSGTEVQQWINQHWNS